MKLNHDCIRDLLLFLEDSLSINSYYTINPYTYEEDVYFDNYKNNDVIYTLQKLIEVGYLNGSSRRFSGLNSPEITISSISWNGHNFLDNIRDDGVWKNTRSILSKFKSTSVGIISDVSAQVISNIISKQLNLL